MTNSNHISQLGKKIVELFSEPATAEDGRPVQRPATRTFKPAPDPRLEELLSKKSVIAAGKLQVIGLDNIREHFGELWERTAEKVHTIVQKTIRSRLTPADLFRANGDPNNPAYFIFFGDLTKEEAQIKSALIAEEIARNILGEDIPPDTVSVKTIVSAVDGKMVAEEVDAIDAVMQVLEDESQDANTEAMPSSSTAPPGSHARPGEQGVARREAEASAAVPEGVRFLYRPVWDVRQNVILTFRCIPAILTPQGNVVTGYDVLGAKIGRHQLIPEVDMMVLNQVLSDFETLHHKTKRLLLARKIHERVPPFPVLRYDSGA